MGYTGTYVDEHGVEHEIFLTDEDSAEALKNDRDELMRRYNPERVTVRQVRAREGEAMRLELTVHAPTHYLTGEGDTTPKSCDEMTCTLVCMPGYPITSMNAAYAADHYLASPNVFRSGGACIDSWKVGVSSLLTVSDKLVRDMIHDPSVTRYDSVANGDMVSWHKRGVEKGSFPTIPEKELWAPELPPMPPRRRAAAAPPPLPPRRAGRS